MQAMQRAAVNHMAARMPQNTRCGVQALPVPDRFDLAWKCEMTATEIASPSLHSSIAKAEPDQDIRNDESSIDTFDAQPSGRLRANTNVSHATEMSATNARVVNHSAPESTENSESKTSTRRCAKADETSIKTSSRLPASAKASQSLNAQGASQEVVVAKSSVVPAPEVKEVDRSGVAAPAAEVMNPAGNPVNTAVVSQTTRAVSGKSREQASPARGTALEVTTNSPRAVDSSVTPSAPKQTAAAQTQETETNHREGSSELAPSPDLLADHTEAVPPAQASHLMTSAVAEVTSTQLSLPHPLTSSPRAELPSTPAIAQASDRSGHQILGANPSQLDVGVFDSTHGWLRIRAELGAGKTVSAYLTAGTAAYEPLRAALPEIASYLQSEAVNVSRIAVHRTGEDSGAMAASAHSQGGDPHARDSGREQPQAGADVAKGLLGQRFADSIGTTTRMAAISLTSILFPGRFGFAGSNCGSWLNVCA